VRSRLLVLTIFASALALASPRPDTRAANSSSVSSWIVADFNGDNKTDFATTSGSGHDERGYSHEVQVSLGLSRQSSFTFLSSSDRVQLRAQDIDGDHDRDIVILEKWSLEPIGIWLNDGLGNFHEGDLADYQTALRNRDQTSLENPATGSKASFEFLEERVQPAVLEPSMAAPDAFVETIAATPSGSQRHAFRSDFRTRAPPYIS
jgi:hypothetical protein